MECNRLIDTGNWLAVTLAVCMNVSGVQVITMTDGGKSIKTELTKVYRRKQKESVL
jgi:hypothetical protein